MTPYRIRRTLWMLGAVLSIAAVVVIAGALSSPDGRSAAAGPTSRPIDGGEADPLDRRELEHYAAVWKRDLRAPLYPPPPRPPPRPRLTVRLVGTVVEPGLCMALLATGSGRVRFCCVGDEAGGARVETIGDGRATVRFAGQRHVLTVPRAKGALR